MDMGKRLLGTVAAWVAAASVVFGQTGPQPPRITAVAPTGGKPGTTFEVTVTGQGLENVEGLYFSFPGAKVEVLSADTAPPNPMKKGGGKAPPGPVLNQKFAVTLPASAPLGFHDLRVVTKAGISNPRAFVVGDQTEVLEKESNDDVPQAQRVDLNTTVSGVILTNTD
ncbi:MAG: hypothetical protein NZO58_11380, partial [Gemmataceae bacterium]|nr:hypothetical protein [Gemmataceae bacterium]